MCFYQEKENDPGSLGQQTKACKMAAMKLGWKILFEETSFVSAENQPMLQRSAVKSMLEHIRHYKIDTVLITSMEDVCGSAEDVEQLIIKLYEWDVKIFCVNKGRWLEQGGKNWMLPVKKAWEE